MLNSAGDLETLIPLLQNTTAAGVDISLRSSFQTASLLYGKIVGYSRSILCFYYVVKESDPAMMDCSALIKACYVHGVEMLKLACDIPCMQ